MKDNNIFQEKFKKKQFQNFMEKNPRYPCLLKTVTKYYAKINKNSANYFFKDKVEKTSEMYMIKATKK